VRHHAFVPRFERIGDEWFVSITPTFFFSENGIATSPFRIDNCWLAKKRLDRNGSLRGQSAAFGGTSLQTTTPARI